MQHEREADLTFQISAPEFQERLRRGIEEQFQQGTLIPLAVEDQRVQFVS